MFKFFFACILMTLPFFAIAQKTGSITIIADSGMPLKLYLDDVKQNDSAVTQIRIDGLTDLWYRVKAVNANTDTLYVSRNLLVKGMDTEPVDVTYKVKRLSNGKVRVTLYSMFSPNPDFKSTPDLYVTKIKLTEPVQEGIISNKVKDQKKSDKIADADYGDSKKHDIDLKKESESVKDTKVNKPNISKNKVEEKRKVEDKNKTLLKKCNGWPITKKDFDLMKKTILESKTEEIKLKNAKSLITGSCFLVSQLDEITNLFKSEESKLEFVKFAYSFTIDRPNYFKLEKYFTTPKSKEEFISIHGE